MPNVVRAVQQQLAKGAGLTINQYGSTTLNGRNRPKANTARLFRFTSTCVPQLIHDPGRVRA